MSGFRYNKNRNVGFMTKMAPKGDVEAAMNNVQSQLER